MSRIGCYVGVYCRYRLRVLSVDFEPLIRVAFRVAFNQIYGRLRRRIQSNQNDPTMLDELWLQSLISQSIIGWNISHDIQKRIFTIKGIL